MSMEKLHGDKFSELRVEKFPEQIQWKLYRAKQHFLEFEREASAWMNVEPSGPGHMVHSPESTPENPVYVYASTEPVPARLGLIAGDFLQNLRSVLDYLVWQLILADGKVPHETNTAFPICKSDSSFKKAKNRCLVGVPDEAIKLIEGLQPYAERQTGQSPQVIHILDELTNQNKHRQVLFTALASIYKPDLPVPFPHIELEVTRYRGGQLVPGERLLTFIAFKGGIMKGVEVTASLSALMDWIGFEVLPQFENFFK
jgi:hypothetical protein